MLPVVVERGEGVVGTDVMGEGDRQPEFRRERGTGRARGQQPRLRERVERDLLHQEPQGLRHVVAVLVVRRRSRPTPQGPRRGLVEGARTAADAQVDPARVQCGQRAELLREHDRSVVGGEDATGSETDGRGGRGRVGGQDDGRERSDGGGVMVLGVPEPLVSEVFDPPGELGGVA